MYMEKSELKFEILIIKLITLNLLHVCHHVNMMKFHNHNFFHLLHLRNIINNYDYTNNRIHYILVKIEQLILHLFLYL